MRLLKNGLIAARDRLLSHAAHLLEHHPKHVTAALAALMLFGGGGAFAVAAIDAEPDRVTVRQVLESVEPLPVLEQPRALDAPSLNLYRTETTRATDTVETLLSRLGVNDAGAAAYLRSNPVVRTQVLGRAGRLITAEATADHALVKITARWAPTDDGQFKRLVVERLGSDQFISRLETAPLTASTRLSSATVRSSLFGAADDAGIPDAVVSQVVEIFSSQIDFSRQLKVGDRFNVVYETLEADGEAMRTGRVLSVDFLNNGKNYQAMWYEEPGRKGSYYSLDGRSLSTSYLASPMEFSRVTSSFAMRLHPILNQWKAHLGVDYGAAIGTPVRVIGDGVVGFAGVKNGFGNVIIVRHNATDETVYAHLSRLDVRAGQSVTQGQRIGAVGMTGWATGPHLHFEYRVNGIHQDPTAMARRSVAAEISAQAMPAFRLSAKAMNAQLQAAPSATVARMQ
ncbi:peptidoglycan DD-metalloendopeptidase family protein [Caenimonas koreensis DSM 17982]|uniref:Peptidoglycan DD-metalloendopeptidase family protein n=1 Tax=Caenimonas koreensis DSM 17982 TaxID=1121255 RepID=A0A844B6A2_9BURK|nr:M23 family metallopeptidase [Caenimonas koreensis]MRD47027.1 peptidoglycan DD-metalloendopeptidase family protein [Caenimonas koreensis DSM 17982]